MTGKGHRREAATRSERMARPLGIGAFHHHLERSPQQTAMVFFRQVAFDLSKTLAALGDDGWRHRVRERRGRRATARAIAEYVNLRKADFLDHATSRFEVGLGL